jgi:hypothetical protein
MGSDEGRYLIRLHNNSTRSYSTCGIKLSTGLSGEVGNLNFTSETCADPDQPDSDSRLNLGTNGKS